MLIKFPGNGSWLVFLGSNWLMNAREERETSQTNGFITAAWYSRQRALATQQPSLTKFTLFFGGKGLHPSHFLSQSYSLARCLCPFLSDGNWKTTFRNGEETLGHAKYQLHRLEKNPKTPAKSCELIYSSADLQTERVLLFVSFTSFLFVYMYLCFVASWPGLWHYKKKHPPSF